VDNGHFSKRANFFHPFCKEGGKIFFSLFAKRAILFRPFYKEGECFFALFAPPVSFPSDDDTAIFIEGVSVTMARRKDKRPGVGAKASILTRFIHPKQINVDPMHCSIVVLGKRGGLTERIEFVTVSDWTG
jgi:hypothetical protein